MAEMFERFAIYDPDGRPLAEDDLGWMSARPGEPNPPPLLTRRVDRATGDQRWLLAKCSILHDDNGLPAMAMYVTEDVTAVKRAELGQWLLAETGRLLSSSHDLDASLQEVAQLTVPALADWCGIELPGPGGFLHLAAIAHLEPAKVARGPPAAHAPSGPRRRRRRGAGRDPDGRAGADGQHHDRDGARGRRRRRRAVRAPPDARPLRAAGGPAALGRERARRADARRVAAAPALRRRRPGDRRGARAAHRRRAAQRAPAARPRGDREGPVGGIAAGRVARAARLRGHGGLPAGRRGRARRRRLLRRHRHPVGVDRRDGRRGREGRSRRGAERGVARHACGPRGASRGSRPRRWTSSTTSCAGAGR